MEFFVKKELFPAWKEFLEPRSPELDSIFGKISGDTYTPAPQYVLRFTENPPCSIKTVVLGQDPYPQPGAATGRAFEVSGLKNWKTPFRQSSLRNILRAVYLAYNDVDFITFKDVLKEIDAGRFSILPPDKLFENLARQGVMLLNTSLTCRVNEPHSHSGLWKTFSRELVHYLSEYTNAVFFLWGNDARSFIPFIPNSRYYASRHPMMCGPYEDDFLKNPCFRETRDVINWRGI